MVSAQDIQPILTIGAALAAIFGIPVALLQQRLSRLAVQAQAYDRLWQCFDAEAARAQRRAIHKALPAGVAQGKAVSDETLETIQAVATAMDRVGYLLIRGHLDDDMVFARYMEVIIPLWEKCEPYLNSVRREKGGGWRFFGPYPSDVPKPAAASRTRRLEDVIWRRPDNLYERALDYKRRAFGPKGDRSVRFQTFVPPTLRHTSTPSSSQESRPSS
jgi:hypothetical protein